MNSRLWSSLLTSTAIIFPLPALAGNYNTDYLFIVHRVWYTCQDFGEAYQEIGTFETANFYVNLCQKGDQYFYSGTAKNKSLKSNFIPAYATEQINTYQADNGNTSYIVEIKSTEATLRITRNGKTVVVETAVFQDCPQASYEPKIQISQAIDYGNYQFQSISDNFMVRQETSPVTALSLFFNANSPDTSEIPLSNQLSATDSPEPPVFSPVINPLAKFSQCF